MNRHRNGAGRMRDAPLIMKPIGRLGGMSRESSPRAHRLLNEAPRERLGGLHFAHRLLRSVDVVEVERPTHSRREPSPAHCTPLRQRRRRRAGAELPVLCEHDAQARRRDHDAIGSCSLASPTPPLSGILLGCTEIDLLVASKTHRFPVFDATGCTRTARSTSRGTPETA